MLRLIKVHCICKMNLGQKAFFPDPSGNSFRFSSDVGDTILSLIVKAPRTSQATRPIRANPLILSAIETSSSDNRWTHSQRPTFSTKKTNTSVSVKIVKASFSFKNGKAEFQKLGRTFISVSEATANDIYISSVIRQKWGEDYVLVTSDGLQLEDSSETQGKYYSNFINNYINVY